MYSLCDVGGTHVKILATGQKQFRRISVRAHVELPNRWSTVLRNSPGIGSMTRFRSAIPARSSEIDRLPNHITSDAGGLGFDFKAAFKRPVKVVNDAAMQAFGSYKGGKMLFLGIGTGSRFCHDRRRHRRTHGAWPSVLQKTHLRRLCRHPRIRSARQKEIAEGGRGRCSPPRCRFGTRGRRFGRRKRQETERATSRLPRGRRTPTHSWAGFASGRKRTSPRLPFPQKLAPRHHKK